LLASVDRLGRELGDAFCQVVDVLADLIGLEHLVDRAVGLGFLGGEVAGAEDDLECPAEPDLTRHARSAAAAGQDAHADFHLHELELAASSKAHV
jgi:hypothetical protein